MSSLSQATIGHERLITETLGSTNAYALDMVSKTNPKEGTVIFTWNQTAGRGQIGRYWHSAPGKNCCFSVVLYPELPARDQFYLNIFAALGLRNALQELLQHPIYLKWPNDVIADNAKIAGILIQNILKGNRISSTVAGIGLNVNQVGFPEDVPNPTSMKVISGASSNVLEVLGVVCRHLDTQYELLRRQAYETLYREYLSALLGYGEQRTYYDVRARIAFQGEITAIEADGRLIINTEGVNKSYHFREIKMHLS